jgi:hypothetical protein
MVDTTRTRRDSPDSTVLFNGNLGGLGKWILEWGLGLFHCLRKKNRGLNTGLGREQGSNRACLPGFSF